ncbi:MAG TPA: cell division protein FtsK [Stenotrophomonas sp.]|nr:cell division protein FtsK [Stenotrophomonas sp.]
MAKQVPERAKASDSKAAPRKPAGEDNPRRQRLWRDLGLIAVAPALLYLVASLFTYSATDPGWSHTGSVVAPVHNMGGRAGAWIADVLLQLFGYMAFVLPIVLGALAWIAMFGLKREAKGEHDLDPALRLVGLVGFLIAGTGFLHLRLFVADVAHAGGILGKLVGSSLSVGFGALGANLFVLVLLLASITLATGISWFVVMEKIGNWVLALPPLFNKKKEQATEWQQTRAMREERQEVRKVDAEVRAKREPVKIEPRPEPVLEKSDRAKRETQIPMFRGVNGDGSDVPPLALLDDPKPQPKGYDEGTLETLSRQIEFKLKDFRIDAQVVGAYPGPVITRFEIEPAPGIKVSQISSLDKDIARGLSVKSVRVVDVIPGKSVVGLEIPNVTREMIYLSELLRSKEYDKSASVLTLALGKDIAGRPTVADLARMPHLLVAGTTGSGKSVAVNAMVLSLLYKASPKDLRMLMIDPKMLELSVYQGIPHLLAPVVTDMKEAANGLRWCVAEMERRYKLMSAVGVRNLAGFNKKVKDAQDAGQPMMDPLFKPNPELGEAPRPLETLPFIVIFIDEFADMMMIVGKKVEELIARLAQKARAAKADMFISIHADAAENRAATGSSVYVLSTKGASSQRARWLADKENAADLVGGVRLQQTEGTLANVLLDLAQSGYMKASEDAAGHVLGGLKRIGKNHKPNIERANFAVLRTSDMPAMLVETAFISNPDEERRLIDPAYQRQIAGAVLDGVHTFFSRQPPPGTLYAARAQAEIDAAGTVAGGSK